MKNFRPGNKKFMFLNKFTFALLRCKDHRNLYIRFKSDVRVRFAPSPTGYLHLGGLRTALYNHLFAKSKNGVSIIRIEDTDLDRTVPLATENILKDLSWCGIQFDEGPYFQSERKELYQEYVKQLLEQGDAYHCFCSKIRLELQRKEAIKAGEIPKYDNHCRHLSQEEVRSILKSGEPYCIRFKLSPFNEPFHDLVCGPVFNDIFQSEGDPIIIKTDGWPTYHFANVVDDHLMKITHVLRGIEWQVSTAKHLLLYRAFKWDPPQYGHLPLLMNFDGTKISKRQGDAQVRYLREAGYFPNAVINFIIRFGGGFDIEQKEKDERSFTLDELVEKFNLTKLKRSSCKANIEDLNPYNALEIKRKLETESEKKLLVETIKNIVQNHFENSKWKNHLQLNDSQIERVLILVKDRIFFLKDLVQEDFEFLWIWSDSWYSDDKNTNEALKKVITIMESVDWNFTDIKKVLKNLSKCDLPMKSPDIFKALRFVLTGIKDKGPSVAEIMLLLGKKEVMFRLSKSLEMGFKTSDGEMKN